MGVAGASHRRNLSKTRSVAIQHCSCFTQCVEYIVLRRRNAPKTLAGQCNAAFEILKLNALKRCHVKHLSPASCQTLDVAAHKSFVIGVDLVSVPGIIGFLGIGRRESLVQFVDGDLEQVCAPPLFGRQFVAQLLMQVGDVLLHLRETFTPPERAKIISC